MRSSLLRRILFQVLSLLILQLQDMKLNVSLSIELGKTSFSSLSSGLGMGMKTTHGRIRRILISILSEHIGKRADSLERCRLGIPAVGTTLMYEFLYLDLGFHNWFGYYVGILGFPHFIFWAGTQVSLSLVMNLVLLCTFCDWVFICLSLSSCCFNLWDFLFGLGMS